MLSAPNNKQKPRNRAQKQRNIRLELAQKMNEIRLAAETREQSELTVRLSVFCTSRKTVSRNVQNGYQAFHRGRQKIVPNQTNIQEIKDETAEKSVFSIGNERKDLARCAGKQRRQARLGKFDKFTVFTTSVGNHFVMERLAETI